ncbi:MAG: CHAT domain-containing protein [Planctomycetes bacterium]|nr:CHAT domain-containing protein [Planctomycetota bacterium]
MSPFLLLPALAALAQESAPASRPAERTIRVGETLTGTVASSDPALPGHGPAAIVGFVAEAAGPVTISVDSIGFDAYLRVETEAGDLVAEDDNGGVETNARLVLEAKAGARYRIVAVASEGGAGEFTLSVAKGDVPRPSGAALLDAGIAFRSNAAERSLARRDKAAALDHRLQEGNRRASRSQHEQARAAYEASLVLARELGDRAREAKALEKLGLVHASLGQYARAREYHERRLSLARERGDRAGEAAALGNLGIVYRSLGEYARAREHLDRQLSLAREQGNRRSEIAALGNLGLVYLRLAELAKARDLLEEQRSLAREVGDRQAEAAALANLGIVYRSSGEYAKAREHLEQGLALARELGYRPAEAAVIGNLGAVLLSLGEYPKARGRFEQALALFRECGDRAGEATALGSLGVVCDVLGDYPEARDYNERHLAVARELGDREGESRAEGSLGNVCVSLGDYPRAREHHERHLAIARELGDRAGEETALGNLGSVSLSLGDGPKARERFEEALALSRELGTREGEAVALANLGHLYCLLGESEKARHRLEESLALTRELGDRAREGLVLARLGEVFRSLGDFPRAAEASRASLDLLGAIGVQEERLPPLATAARAALAQGDLRTALSARAEAETLLERPSLRFLEVAEAAGVRSRVSEWGEVAQDLTALRLERSAGDEAAREAIRAEGFAESGRWKGRALLEGIAEHRSGARSGEALRIRRECRDVLARRDGILERISRAVREGKPAEELEVLQADARSLLAKAENLAAKMREASPRDASLDLSLRADSEALRQAAGQEVALVDYAEGERRIYAYVLTEKGLAWLDLGERKPIEAAAGEYAFSTSSLETGVSVQGIAEKGHALFERLLAPVLREAAEGVRRLVVVPTPALAGVPFEALVMGRKARGTPTSFADVEFVLDRYEVCYAPSSPVLVELAALGPRTGEDKILVLSDPVYPAESGEPAGGSESRPSSLLAWGGRRALPEPGRLERLRKTREEAIGLAQLLLGPEEEATAAALTRLSDRRSASLSGKFFDLHLGAEASRRRLAGDLRQYSVLHFAAHGYVDREFPQRTGIALSFEGGEDGFFSIRDVLDELDLDAKFVVLSACDTARGEVKAGEGVESMARAFMYAGARGVVASLWQVSDWAAAETMGEFYRGALKRGLPPSQALREAKLSLRRSKGVRGVAGLKPAEASFDPGHPYFWAPFICIGLPR